MTMEQKALDARMGHALRAARNAAGMKQEELAKRMRAEGFPGFSAYRVSGLELGERRFRYAETIALAKILGVDVTALEAH